MSDNAYLHAEAARFGKAAVLVPVWSPEVRFLFDRAESLESQMLRLAKLGITRVTPHGVDSPFGRFFHSYPFFVAVNRDWPRDEHGMCVPPSPVRKTGTE